MIGERQAIRKSPVPTGASGGVAVLRQEQGRLDEAVSLFEQALRLDPLNTTTVRIYGTALLSARQYDAAAEPLRRAALLNPKSIQLVLYDVMRNAGKGDLPSARAVIREAYKRFPPADVDAYMATYNDYGWILDDSAQQRVLEAPASAFDNDVGVQMVSRAQIPHARGDLAGSRAAARLARPALATHGAKGDRDPQLALHRGIRCRDGGAAGGHRTAVPGRG